MKNIKLCTGSSESKTIAVRLSLREGENSMPQYHRVDIAVGDSLSDARATIEAHLTQPYEVSGIPGAPWPKIPDEEWAEVEQIAAILHTPERIAKRQADDAERDRKFFDSVSGDAKAITG